MVTLALVVTLTHNPRWVVTYLLIGWRHYDVIGWRHKTTSGGAVLPQRLLLLTYSGRFTQYPHKWSPVSRRSRAGQRKFACQRPTFYHCAMQPTSTRRATGFGGYICFFIHLPVVYRVWESIVETMFKPKSGRKVDSGVWTYSCMMRRPTKVVERVFSVCGDLQVLS